MDSRSPVDHVPTPDAIEFVRFCYGRRRVGWPELYDEMCAVAGRGLFRGWGSEELAARGIRFGLFELPSLAAVVSRVISEEQERQGRRVRSEPGREGWREGSDVSSATRADPDRDAGSGHARFSFVTAART